VAHGLARLADTKIHLRTTGPTPDCDSWNFDVDLTVTDDAARAAFQEALGLPECIAIDPEDPAGDLSSWSDAIRSFLEAFDRNLKPEIYIVAGDLIYRMDNPCLCSDADTQVQNSFHDFVQRPLERWAANGSIQTDEYGYRGPWLPMDGNFEMNAVLNTQYSVGVYGMAPDQTEHCNFKYLEFPRLEVQFDWDTAEDCEYVEGEPGDDQWNWFSQLLASARPAQFSRYIDV